MKTETILWSIVILIAGGYLVYRTSQRRMAVAYVQEVDGQETAASAWDEMAGTAQFSLSRTVGVWVGAIFTISIMSFLYKDNPFYKTAEATVVGVSAAYWMVVGFWDVIVPNLLGKLTPGLIQAWAMPGLSPLHDAYWFFNLIPLVLGVMLIWRLAPVAGWISRWPLALIIGTTAGLRMVGFLKADFLSQIRSTVLPLVATTTPAPGAAPEFDLGASVANTLIIASVLACLVYFFFSFEHTGLVGKVSRVGIWVLMITFGAGFGYTVMGRIALLAARFEFLFDDWLWLIDPKNLRP